MSEKFYKALKIFTAVFGIVVWILLVLPERWSLPAESEMRILSFLRSSASITLESEDGGRRKRNLERFQL